MSHWLICALGSVYFWNKFLEQRVQVLVSADNAQNGDVVTHNLLKDDVSIERDAAQAWA
jgi:hypothetical protein